MELLLSLKKCLRWAGLGGRFDGMLDSHAPLSPKATMYIQGREGPQLCSLVSLTRKQVLDSMSLPNSECCRDVRVFCFNHFESLVGCTSRRGH